MFDPDTVRLLMKAAVELERHGTLPADTQMRVTEALCCGECAEDLLNAAIDEAL